MLGCSLVRVTEMRVLGVEGIPGRLRTDYAYVGIPRGGCKPEMSALCYVGCRRAGRGGLLRGFSCLRWAGELGFVQISWRGSREKKVRFWLGSFDPLRQVRCHPPDFRPPHSLIGRFDDNTCRLCLPYSNETHATNPIVTTQGSEASAVSFTCPTIASYGRSIVYIYYGLLIARAVTSAGRVLVRSSSPKQALPSMYSELTNPSMYGWPTSRRAAHQPHAPSRFGLAK